MISNLDLVSIIFARSLSLFNYLTISIKYLDNTVINDSNRVERSGNIRTTCHHLSGGIYPVCVDTGSIKFFSMQRSPVDNSAWLVNHWHPLTFTKVRFFSLNFKTKQTTLLNFWNQMFYPRGLVVDGFKGGFVFIFLFWLNL